MHSVKILLASAVCLAACDDYGTVRCSDELRFAVRVTVVDAAGNSVADALVTYSVDDGPSKECSTEDGQYRCGLEEEGRISVLATREGQSGSGKVKVRADQCHVAPEDLSITLTPAP